ncbi:MAG: phytanoyl-CoA dioxygenase family protein [Chloroflexota bacterium]|nr:phytanoyl-CoA dioxygenase family protein [Chloroflexota bacterium]MDE2907614.1 phytanoyl-CoA dioxygenase family protein [Chloroflexota bacterium]
MNDIEQYEFDRLGYLVIPSFLSDAEVSSLSAAIDAAEEDALAQLDRPPDKISAFGIHYRHHPEKGYFVSGAREEGDTLIIEDFYNADPAFDILIDHPPTMKYIRAIVKERPTINNSEIRIRYPGNQTGSHMGGPVSRKHRYYYSDQGIDCMMVRTVYFVHDVNPGQGEFCVVPATHKSNMPSPYEGRNPDTEPGMIGLPVKAGDAILFTENLRHGGFTNQSKQTRKTLHVGYGPFWMKSQNHSTMDEEPNVLPSAFARWNDAQRLLFRAHRTLLD